MIKRFLSDAFLSIVMDKKAKDNYRTIREHKKRAVNTDIATGDTKSDSMPPAPAPIEQTPERAELIRNTLAVHQEKSSVLDDLSVDDRQKLFTLAEKALLGKKQG